MVSELFAAANRWWRWSKYEVRGGYICPAPSARLESYSVWELQERAKALSDEPPYLSLVKLADDVAKEFPLERIVGDWAASTGCGSKTSGRDQRATAGRGSRSREAGPLPTSATVPEDALGRAEAHITAWCGKHGLLGLLPMKTLSVYLRPVRERVPELGKRRILGQKRHNRAAKGWTQHFVVGGKLHKACAYIKGGRGWEEERLNKTWGGYFPSVPRAERGRFQYPLPLSNAFWEMYAEPVVQFMLAAIEFRNALDGLAKVGNDQPRARLGVSHLHDLTEGVRPILTFEKHQDWDQTWVAPSLLSTFAMMALLDLLEGRRVLRCAACRKPTWTKNPKTLYCGNHCRWAAQKRQARGRPRDVAGRRGRPPGALRETRR